ncbi:MAG: glycosyltransferase family 2 protein [Planctomycetota bacterium]
MDAVTTSAQPVEVRVPTPPTGGDVGTGRVAVHVVTWNRKEMVDRCLRAIAEQTHGAAHLDVVVIDNGSQDGTVEYLTERWRPERTVSNPTERAHEPEFQPPTETGLTNNGAFRSLTIVANAHNFGGCGGFNTGFAYTEHAHDRGESDRPEFVWLVDDDAIPHERCVEQLIRGARSHEDVGLVGSRMVDMTDHDRTLETTVYYTPSNGLLGPGPEPGHAMYESHRQWVKGFDGQTHGYGDFNGLRDVDVQAACSLLGKWEAVKNVGFWDSRYFIYNDDADWCLRFKKAGYRVLINLDSIIYHEPWHAKQTPARSYYGQRNVVWMVQKLLPARELRRVTLRRMGRLMVESMRALWMRRLFHADLIRRTAADIMDNRGGKLEFAEPNKEDAIAAMERAGLLHAGARVALMCQEPYMVTHALNLREGVRSELAQRQQQAREPRWVFVVRNDHQADGAFLEGDARSEAIVYGPQRRSKWIKKPLLMLARPPAACVVFDQNNDVPLLSGGWNLHMDTRVPEKLQAEPGGVGARAKLLARWLMTGARSAFFAATARPTEHRGTYGV